MRLLSTALIVAGLVLLADAGMTLVWQEPVSAVYAHRQQDRLGDRLARLEAAPRPFHPRRRARAFERGLAPGDPMGRILIPSLGVSQVFVQGTDLDLLRAGPGHFPQTPLPGERGTVAIAGHRTTYGAPFRRIGELAAGARIELRMPYGRFAYRVERTRIVAPTEISVIARARHDRLVLSACHPLYSAAQRLVVQARLVDIAAPGRR
jgi:sortase A